MPRVANHDPATIVVRVPYSVMILLRIKNPPSFLIVIEVESITKSYQSKGMKFDALDGVSFVAEGPGATALTFTALIAGTVFPITVFPYFLRLIAYAVPPTWALKGLRDALLLGYGLPQLSQVIGILAVFDIITVPLGYFIFVICFTYTKKNGSLLEY